jgi:hypothetical protein
MSTLPRHKGGAQVYLHSASTSALDRNEWSKSRSGRLTPPGERTPVRDAASVAKTVWSGLEMATSLTGLRTPVRPPSRYTDYATQYSTAHKSN